MVLGATGGVYIKYQDYQADIEKKSLDERSRHNKNIENENERHHKQTEVDNCKHHRIKEEALDQQNRQLSESNKLKNTENQLKEQELEIQRRKMENDSQQQRYLAERTWSQFIFGKKKELIYIHNFYFFQEFVGLSKGACFYAPLFNPSDP